MSEGPRKLEMVANRCFWIGRLLAATLAAITVFFHGCGGPTVTKEPEPETLSLDTTSQMTDFLSAPSKKKPLEVKPRFESVAEESGIDFTFFSDTVPGRFLLPEIMGGGAAWFDFDGDGLLDLYLMNGCHLEQLQQEKEEPGKEKEQVGQVNRLFSNRGDGRFVDVSLQAGGMDAHYGQGVAVGDFNADGFPDLYLANFGANVLLQNNGDGTFVDITGTAGVGDELWGTSPIWLDLDGDKLLDLYVTNYLQVTTKNIKVCEYDGVPGYCGPGSYDAAPDRAFINQGDGSFVEAAQRYGLLASGGKGLAIAALDFDLDLKPEIYVANDMRENFLFRRNVESDQPLYENVASRAGCAVSATGEIEASMGVACADFDGDGLVDLFLTHYYANKNTLYRNLGNLVFHDNSRRSRIAATSYETLGFGTVPLDYDQDGATDLFITNGHVLGPGHSPNTMPPQLLRNDGQGLFTDISESAGKYFRDLWLGRGAAGGDYDNDGDLDLIVTHIDRPVALLNNETETKHHWIGFDLRSADRLHPVGGRVVVQLGDRQISLPVVAGGSYLSNGDPRLLFGLGDHSTDVDVEIYWPSGQVDAYTGLEIDRYWQIADWTDPIQVGPVR